MLFFGSGLAKRLGILNKKCSFLEKIATFSRFYGFRWLSLSKWTWGIIAVLDELGGSDVSAAIPPPKRTGAKWSGFRFKILKEVDLDVLLWCFRGFVYYCHSG